MKLSKSRLPFWLAATLTLGAGLFIAWMDTRPHWDDAGVTAGAILIAAGAGALAGVPPWLATTLAVGPILATEISGNTGVLLAVPFAVAGAVIGYFLHRRRA